MNATRSDELFVKAFNLAYFIHCDKEVALKVASESLAKLEVACAAQDKRLYYNPLSRRSRTKVNLSEPHLLQRLIYIESEPYEQEKEKSRSLDEEDMVIHYIKHLVRITIKRNSFYVTLALSRLLHNYSTAETADIYSLVVQDPERVKNDYYYRSRKGRLMKEIKERFANLIKVAHGHRGEEKFQTLDDSRPRAGVVRDCLDRFTPWRSPCVVPERFDRFGETIPDLSFDGDEPDEEHRIEANRLHSVLHPDCYGRLTEALEIDSPDERLGVPQFFHSGNGKRPPDERRRPPRLGYEELAAVQCFLAEQAARRRVVSGGLMRIMVDGRERASLDILRTGRARFEIEEGAEIIEVRTRQKNDDLLLALLLPDFDRMRNGEQESSITLEGGQKLVFSLSPSKDDYDEFAGAFVEIAYKETRLASAASLALRRLGRAASERLRAGFEEEQTRRGNAEHRPTPRHRWKPAFALLFLTLLIASVFFLTQRGKDAPRNEEMVQSPPSQPAQEDRSVQPGLTQDNSSPDKKYGEAPEQPKRPRLAENRRQRKAPQTKDEFAGNRLPDERDLTSPDVATDETRDTNPEMAGVTLVEVKRVRVELLTDGPLDQRIQELASNALQSSGRFNVVAGRNEADAVLKLVVAKDSATGETTMIVRLINAAGFVLWPADTSGSGAKYARPEVGAIASMVNDLIRAAENVARNPARR